MEGTSEAVNRLRARGGRQRRPVFLPLWCTLILSIAVSSAATSQTSDVLIIEKTDHLIAYNSFQQSLSSLGKNTVPPFAPLKILQVNDLLGDRITPCTKVSLEGEVFYLLRGDGGKLAGWKDLGIVRVFRNVRFIEDTVAIIGSGRFVMRGPLDRGSRVLRATERCIRYFASNGSYYVRTLGSNGRYGWVDFPGEGEGSTWRVVRPSLDQVGLPPMIRDRVVERIDKFNASMRDVYELLSRQTRKRFPAPQWSMRMDNAALVCTLNPSAAVGFYRSSIRDLSAALQTYVLGTGYEVSVSGNTIQVRHR
jgi:hypothetical protein